LQCPLNLQLRSQCSHFVIQNNKNIIQYKNLEKRKIQNFGIFFSLFFKIFIKIIFCDFGHEIRHCNPNDIQGNIAKIKERKDIANLLVVKNYKCTLLKNKCFQGRYIVVFLYILW
jgi:hypothetical protein